MNPRSKIMMALAALSLSAGSASAQTVGNLSIVSGNGQVVCPVCSQNAAFFFQPMEVFVTDINGNPLSGVTVNWAITSQALPAQVQASQGVLTQSGTSTYSATTDSNGHAVANYQLASEPPGSPQVSVAQALITATAGTFTVNFYLTEALQDPFNPGEVPLSATIQNSSLLPGETFTGQLSTTSTTPIQVFISSEGGQGIPNVGIFLVDAITTGGTIQCSSSPSSPSNAAGLNEVLSGTNGIAYCYPAYGGTPSTGNLFWADVGGAQGSSITQPASAYLTFPILPYLPTTGVGGGYNYSVTPGTPGSIVLISGNSQSANPGQTLQPLVAQVLNASGQPLTGVTVNWSVSPANAATLSATTTTASNGQTSNTVVLSSSASGAIIVTASPAGSSSKITYSITAVPLVTITSFTIIGGNNQSAAVGQAFAQPLAVQVNSSAGPASGVAVQFQVQSGSVILSSTSATTNVNGQASVTAVAGSITGSATVVATITSASGSSSQTFNLNVLPQGPTITASNFYNAADLKPSSFSPCGLTLLIGSSNSLGIPDVAATFPGLPAPQTTVAITVNSVNAPVLNIGTDALGQQFVLFQVPCSVSPSSSVPVVVNIGGSTSNVNLNIQPAAPGIFQEVDSDGVARAVVVRPDGSFATQTNPARRGETEVVYVTGLGPTNPTVGTTAVPVPGGTPAVVTGTVVPGMAGGGVPLVSAQLSPDLPGIYAVTFQIPTSEATGDVNFSIGLIPVGSSTVYYSGVSKINVQ